MARQRDVLEHGFDPNLVERRLAEGWQPVAIEWERTTGEQTPQVLPPPFGFRVASDGTNLEENADEMQVLREIMRGIVNDRSLTLVSEELNRRGLRTREGAVWNPASVFRLMPAVVENGPRIFSDSDWPTLRRA